MVYYKLYSIIENKISNELKTKSLMILKFEDVTFPVAFNQQINKSSNQKIAFR
ncbi:MAG: hypothetical protein H6Q21_2108 [Bacteroidetes bacterium]|nr:hypothetical protein [Bacteroidota bacterium]